MFFELPWVGVAKDAMAVAISIKYVVYYFLLTKHLAVSLQQLGLLFVLISMKSTFSS